MVSHPAEVVVVLRRRLEAGVKIGVVEEARALARLPSLAEARRAQVPVRADSARGVAKVPPKIVDRRPAPEPVAVAEQGSAGVSG